MSILSLIKGEKKEKAGKTSVIMNTIFVFSMLTGIALASDQNKTILDDENSTDKNISKEVKNTQKSASELVQALIGDIKYNKVTESFYSDSNISKEAKNKQKVEKTQKGDLYYISSKKDLRNMPYDKEFILKFSSKKSLNSIFAKDLQKNIEKIVLNGKNYTRGKNGKFYRDFDGKVAKLLNGTKLIIPNPQNLAIRNEDEATIKNSQDTNEFFPKKFSMEYVRGVLQDMLYKKYNDRNDGSGYAVSFLKKIGVLDHSKGQNANSIFYNYSDNITSDLSKMKGGEYLFLPATKNKRQELLFVDKVTQYDELGNPKIISVYRHTSDGLIKEEKSLSSILGRGRRKAIIGTPSYLNLYEKNKDKIIEYNIKKEFTNSEMIVALSKNEGRKYKRGIFDCSKFIVEAFWDLGIIPKCERPTAREIYNKYAIKKRLNEISTGDILFTSNKQTDHIAYVEEVLERDEKGKPLIVKISENTRKYGARIGKIVNFNKFSKGRTVKVATLKNFKKDDKEDNLDYLSNNISYLVNGTRKNINFVLGELKADLLKF